MIQTRHHIDGFDFWVLTIFRRAHFDAQITAGAIFRCDLQHVFLSTHVAGFHIQRMQAGRGVFHVLRGNHFSADRRVRTGRDAVVALSTQLLLPDWDLFGNIAFFPAGGADRPGAVRRKRRDGQGIAKTGQHRGGHGFDKIWGGVGDYWRTVGTAGINRLKRDLGN
ncbi:hypothetical protein D3C86_1414350 [compost metagenome]